MGEACKECRSWEEEIYWNHFQCIHFIQYLYAGFDQQLAIPEKVAGNLKNKLSVTVSLKGPSGFMWVVGITTRDNTMYFCHGWPEFVKNHLLEENDILVFKYNGDSHFDVLMFDGQSKCEKAASYFVRKCGHAEHGGECQTKRKIGESSVEVIPTSPHCEVEGTPPEKTDDVDINRKSVGQPIVSLASSKRVRRVNSSVKPVHTRRSLRTKELCTSFVENGKATPGAESISFIGDVGLSPHYASSRRPVTEDEKKKVLLLAQSASTADSFSVVMRPTHVHRRFYMTIPAGWMTKHFTMENQDVILRSNEKTWVTRFQFCKPRCSGGLCGGWKNFAIDNNLDEFDVCVFKPEVMETKPLSLNVSIFRVVNAVSPLIEVSPSYFKLKKLSPDAE